jgi:hypothetical protein
MLKKLANLFPHADKVLHFIVGALVSLVICLFVSDPAFGFAGAFLIGLGKEYSDHIRSGSGGIQTWLDWFATMAGGAFVSLLF